MSYVLKKIEDEGENYASPHVFSGKIKIGSDVSSELCISSHGILPFHCELYSWGKEHRLALSEDAGILINGKEPEVPVVTLHDGDILLLAEHKYRFHILHDVMKRSWKASFSAQLASVLLILLVIFELILIVYLPYSLAHEKRATLQMLKQDIYMNMDKLRSQTENMEVSSADTDGQSIKNLLTSCNTDLVIYLRRYGFVMPWSDTRSVDKSMHMINNIVQGWPQLKKVYTKKITIDPSIFVSNLADKLENKAIGQDRKPEVPDYTINLN